MYKVILLPLSKLDISDAATWYDTKQKGLGKRFTKEVRAKISFILENPKAYAIRYDKTRCAVLDIFPFLIHYTIDEKSRTIIVAAILHTSLNPKKWSNR